MHRHPSTRNARSSRTSRAVLGLLAIAAALITTPILAALAATPAPVAGSSIMIHIGSSVEPSIVTVAPGTAITWHNLDATRHRMRLVSGPQRFDTGDLAPGQSSDAVVLTREGTYTYADDVSEHRGHAAYSGTVVVRVGVGSGVPVPGPAAPPATTPPPPATASVSIVNDQFAQRTVTVAVGGTVTWTNSDARAHTVTAVDGSFDSGILAKGGTVWRRTFPAAGTFNYVCDLHSNMTGTVLVTNGGTPPPPAQTPPPASAPPPATTTPPSVPTSSVGAPPAATAVVSMAGGVFGPRSVTVAVGGTVTWSNNDTRPHTVTAADASFDSGIVLKGGTFTRTFPVAGTFNYVCELHSNMTATVLVTNGATPPPAAAPTKAAPVKAAPSTPAPSASSAASAASATVSMRGSAFTPRIATVRPGGTVTWVNDDRSPHTVTAADGSFDSGTVSSGGTFRRTFPVAGTFNYECIFHPGMTGTIVVKETAASVAPAAKPAIGHVATGGATHRGSAATVGASAVKASVRMADNTFSPQALTIPAGSSVTFTNIGKAPHTATASGAFDSGMILPGGSWATTFRTPGTFRYVCIVHPGMVGTITVTEAAAGSVAGDGAGTGGGGGGGQALEVGEPVVAIPTPGAHWAVALLVGTIVLFGGALLLWGVMFVERPGIRRGSLTALRALTVFIWLPWSIAHRLGARILHRGSPPTFRPRMP